MNPHLDTARKITITPVHRRNHLWKTHVFTELKRAVSCEPKLEFEPNLSDSKKPVLNHSITHRRKEGQNVPFKQWEGQLDWRLKYLNIRKKRHTGKKKNGEKFEKTPNVSLRVLACFVLQNQFGKVDTRKIACMFPLKEPLNTNTNVKERTNRESVAGVFSYNNK